MCVVAAQQGGVAGIVQGIGQLRSVNARDRLLVAAGQRQSQTEIGLGGGEIGACLERARTNSAAAPS